MHQNLISLENWLLTFFSDNFFKNFVVFLFLCVLIYSLMQIIVQKHHHVVLNIILQTKKIPEEDEKNLRLSRKKRVYHRGGPEGSYMRFFQGSMLLPP